MDLYEKLSEARKQAVAEGKFPEWTTTGSYQMFKENYEYQADGLKEQLWRIADTLSKYAVPFIPKTHPLYETITKNHGDNWKDCFFSIQWINDFQASTPALANTGTNRGMSVSCSGGYVGDSIIDFYEANTEAAMLSKMGFGTSYYLGDVRERGAVIGTGGIADGTDHPKSLLQKTAQRVSQGGVRRGSVACYLPVTHPDFEEWAEDLQRNPQGQNIGWNYYDDEIQALKEGLLDPDNSPAHKRTAKVVKTRMNRGKGYMWKPDTVNRLSPPWYKECGWSNKASNLCTEITLHSDEEHSFSCIISSMNAVNFKRWKDTGSVFIATIMLDAMCNEFLEKAKNVKGLEKVVRYTRKAKSLGLGCLGVASYLQDNMLPFTSIEARMARVELFKHIEAESIGASEYVYECGGGAEMMVAYAKNHPEWKPRAHSHLCVTKDTKLATKNGLTEIGNLVGQEVEIWNGYEWSKVTPYKTGENRDIYRVQLSNGRYLDCTAEHLWMVATPERSNNVKGSYVQIKVPTSNLRVGDCIPKTLGSVIDSETMPDLPNAYSSGVFCGDGSINCSMAGKYPRNEIRLYGEKVKLKEHLNWKSVDTWPLVIDGKEVGIRGYLVDELLPKYEVPLNYSLKSRLEWLAGLIDTDGSSTRHGISICTAREELAEGLLNLLQTLGCFGHKAFCKRTGGYSAESEGSWVVGITQMECMTLKRLGINLHRCVLPEGVGDTLTKLSSKQFVKVTSIDKLDKQDTYCLTEPKNGTCIFNGVYTAQCAVAPNVSSACLAGQVSQGIEPYLANIFMQPTSAGELRRINPLLLKLMKERGKYNNTVIKRIIDNKGSVQQENWLTPLEKTVLLTAFEINQLELVQCCADIQPHVDQGISLNLFFDSEADPDYIKATHLMVLFDDRVKGAYYCRSESGVSAAKDTEACVDCAS